MDSSGRRDDRRLENETWCFLLQRRPLEDLTLPADAKCDQDFGLLPTGSRVPERLHLGKMRAVQASKTLNSPGNHRMLQMKHAAACLSESVSENDISELFMLSLSQKKLLGVRILLMNFLDLRFEPSCKHNWHQKDFRSHLAVSQL